MAPTIFSIVGRICFADGDPAADVTLAVADADPLRDDLIGLGLTGFDGRFRLSFTRAAFNQDPLENELLPDLYVLCSLPGPDGLVPVHRADFPGLRFAVTPEDLGDIRLPLRAGDPIVRRGIVSVPQSGKLARRTDLTDEVRAALHARAAALVGPLLGVDHPLDGVSIHETHDLPAQLLASLAGVLGGADPLGPEDLAALREGFDLDGVAALFDPFTKIIHLGPGAERQNLDALTVALGRELVHASQFSRVPWLLDEYRERLRDAWHCGVLVWRGLPDDEAAALASADGLFGLLATIEGYASYLETYFFRPRYRCALPLAHQSTLGALFGGIWRAVDALQARTSPGLFTRPSLRAFFALDDRRAQEQAGLRAYRARQLGGLPVPFDPSLRPRLCSSLALDPPLGRDEARHAAEQGDLLAQWTLGQLLLGDPTTQSEALRWLRRAATGGHREALWLLARRALASQDPHDRAEALAWLQQAADQGLPAAQLDLAGHLAARPDLPAWLRWTERAAEQGFAPAQITLGDAHATGRATPPDPSRALVWYQRAARQDSAEARARLAAFFLSATPRDPARALPWARLSAEAGDPHGRYLLALCLREGWGTAPDHPPALSYLQAAARGGSPLARAALADPARPTAEWPIADPRMVAASG
jgi:hypothetical protein